MARNDVVNKDGSINWDTIGGFKEQLMNIAKQYGTSAPTTGTWQLADKVWNTNPVAGGNVGWICVQAGTFGSGTNPIFKTFGNISS